MQHSRSTYQRRLETASARSTPGVVFSMSLPSHVKVFINQGLPFFEVFFLRADRVLESVIHCLDTTCERRPGGLISLSMFARFPLLKDR